MKMVVGLGNPGEEYQNTRHNSGFIIVDNYLKEHKINKMHNKFNGLYTKIYRNNDCFIIVKPLSFMNLSGTVIKKYADYFKIDPKDILVIHDDIDLPVGKIKLKFKGSSGGHNGIKNIIENLGTEYFPRFKIGIARDNRYSIKDYVISDFSKKERQTINKICDFSNQVIDDFLDNDFEKVMSKYNGDLYEIHE